MRPGKVGISGLGFLFRLLGLKAFRFRFVVLVRACAGCKRQMMQTALGLRVLWLWGLGSQGLGSKVGIQSFGCEIGGQSVSLARGCMSDWDMRDLAKVSCSLRHR